MSRTSPPLLRTLFAGVTHHGVSAPFAERVLGELPAGALTAHLDEVLASRRACERLGRDSYLHANGFFKLVLFREDSGFAVRLHYWPGGTRAEENVHSHRWSFASKVMFGDLDSVLYAWVERGELHAFRYAREGADARIEPLGRAGVRALSTQTHHAGGVYHLAPDRLHRIAMTAARPTLTLMVQSAPILASNVMLCASPSPDVRPEPLGTGSAKRLLREIRDRLLEVA